MISGILTQNGEQLPSPLADQVEFKVAFNRAFTKIETDKEQGPVNIYCSWRNRSSAPVAVLLKDHDATFGTLDFVYGMRVRILSAQGKVLTATAARQLEWWSFSSCCSIASSLMPGDIVTLQPGETVVRRFKLEDVLLGLKSTQATDEAPLQPSGTRLVTGTGPCSPFEFPVGANTIEVRCWNLVATNPLTLRVKNAVNQAASQP